MRLFSALYLCDRLQCKQSPNALFITGAAVDLSDSIIYEDWALAIHGNSMDATTTILLIDDDKEFCALLQDYLELNSIGMNCAHSAKAGLKMLANGKYDLILLDMFLPDMNGLDVLSKLRASLSTPVVIVSAHNDETDRIIALESGADDYVAKSFSSRELLARIRAVLRRYRGMAEGEDAESENIICLRGLLLDSRAMEATLDNESLNLTVSEFQILAKLMSRPGMVFSRESLLNAITDRGFNRFDRSIDMHISSLRRKLHDDSGDPRFIKTLRGVGYSMIR